MCYEIPCCWWNDWAEVCTKSRWDPCPVEMDDDEDYGDGLTAAESARQEEQLAAWEEARDFGQI